MLLDKFEASLPENVMDVSEQKSTVIENLKLNLSQEEYQKVVASSEFKNWNELLMAHISDIRNKRSDLEKFWHTYFDLCELLLNLAFPTRSGNWELYLSCIEEVIPWAFAYNRQKYARSFLSFLNDMCELPSTFPEVYPAFCNGESSVQMSHSNPFW